MSLFRVKVGKQGRLVLPKEVREAYDLDAGDEITIIVKRDELTMHVHKTPEDPLKDLSQLSESISIGFSAKDLQRKADEERLASYEGPR